MRKEKTQKKAKNNNARRKGPRKHVSLMCMRDCLDTTVLDARNTEEIKAFKPSHDPCLLHTALRVWGLMCGRDGGAEEDCPCGSVRARVRGGG